MTHSSYSIFGFISDVLGWRGPKMDVAAEKFLCNGTKEKRDSDEIRHQR